MKRRMILIAALMMLMLAMTAGVALACPVCGAPSKTTISGPGLNGTVEVNDAKVTASLGMDQFFGWQNRKPIDPPTNPGVGYDLYRTWEFGSDHLRYFPSTAGHGTIFYTQDSLELAQQLNMENTIDHWFAATAQEDTIMQRVFASVGVKAQSASAADSNPPSAAANASASSASTSVSPVWLIGLAAVIAIGVGTIALRRKRA